MDLKTSKTVKRMIDICISGLLLVLTTPVMIFAGLWVKAFSDGPVLFLQWRLGENKAPFVIFKIRTMHYILENKILPTSIDDKRIIKGGKFLRRTRIDELPQLVNILLGDMSLVGPRPELPHFSEIYENQFPIFRDRFNSKPGLTGLSQIRVGYAQEMHQIKAKAKVDSLYNEHWNNCFDIFILLKTIPIIFTGRGAR